MTFRTIGDARARAAGAIDKERKDMRVRRGAHR
jgi:hypothetical protein